MVTVTYAALFNSQTLCPPQLLTESSQPSFQAEETEATSTSRLLSTAFLCSRFWLTPLTFSPPGMRRFSKQEWDHSYPQSCPRRNRAPALQRRTAGLWDGPPHPLAPTFLPTGVTPESPVSSSGPQAPCVRAASPQRQVALTHGNSKRPGLFTPFTAPRGCPGPAGFLSFLSLRPWAPRKQGCFSFTASRVPGTLASAQYCK